MVPACSIKVSRVSMYSGYRLVSFPFAYGAFTLSGRLSQNLSARITESIMRSNPAVHAQRFGLFFHFARRYSGNRCFFLFLRLLRCFSSPGSLPYVMDWRMDDWSPSSRVSPIQTSADQRLFASPPQLFAAYHVFLRLLVPRHPPCALFA